MKEFYIIWVDIKGQYLSGYNSRDGGTCLVASHEDPPHLFSSLEMARDAMNKKVEWYYHEYSINELKVRKVTLTYGPNEE